INRLRLRIIIILGPFDVEKPQPVPYDANSEVECRAGQKFLPHELLERGCQYGWKKGIRSALGNQRDGTRLGTAQLTIQNENGKERVRRSSELHCNGSAR